MCRSAEVGDQTSPSLDEQAARRAPDNRRAEKTATALTVAMTAAAGGATVDLWLSDRPR